MISKCAHLNGLLLSACREVLVLGRSESSPVATNERVESSLSLLASHPAE